MVTCVLARRARCAYTQAPSRKPSGVLGLCDASARCDACWPLASARLHVAESAHCLLQLRATAVALARFDLVPSNLLHKHHRPRPYCQTRTTDMNPDPLLHLRCTMSDKQPKYLYHYTDANALGKIAESGQLNPSLAASGRDAALGSGVYFTSMPPQSGNSRLLNNNYDSARVNPNKVEAYIRVPADQVAARSGSDVLGRSVYVVPTTQPLDLHGTGAVGGFRKRFSD